MIFLVCVVSVVSVKLEDTRSEVIASSLRSAAFRPFGIAEDDSDDPETFFTLSLSCSTFLTENLLFDHYVESLCRTKGITGSVSFLNGAIQNWSIRLGPEGEKMDHIFSPSKKIEAQQIDFSLRGQDEKLLCSHSMKVLPLLTVPGKAGNRVLFSDLSQPQPVYFFTQEFLELVPISRLKVITSNDLPSSVRAEFQKDNLSILTRGVLDQTVLLKISIGDPSTGFLTEELEIEIQPSRGGEETRTVPARSLAFLFLVLLVCALTFAVGFLYVSRRRGEARMMQNDVERRRKLDLSTSVGPHPQAVLTESIHEYNQRLASKILKKKEQNLSLVEGEPLDGSKNITERFGNISGIQRTEEENSESFAKDVKF